MPLDRPAPALAPLRDAIRAARLAPEGPALAALIAAHGPDADLRDRANRRGAALVEQLRADRSPGLMEVFLAEYGLSTKEGVALMCLAEALLRVPDAATMDALIEDKIAPSEWGAHLGHSASPLVNASTWALMLTGRVLQDGEGMAGVLKGALRRLGEPVIRAAVARAMREMGQHFVLGQTMTEAMARAAGQEARGYAYSYDMLGEAAMTARDAHVYFEAYRGAIRALAPACKTPDVRRNPGISVKLSALFPRYEQGQRDRVMAELVPRLVALAEEARALHIGLSIDAEEADRLDLSLDVIAAALADPTLAGWDGFGIVVQAYGKRAGAVIDWLHALATHHDRRIMLRLVKGAYWDTEIKRAQVAGLKDFPVWTRKPATDAAYLCLARKLLGLTDRIFPQFATHNAHTVAAILEMGGDHDAYEFQRLHGMGEALHELVRKGNGPRCRIYAPVGKHRDLLAYLVRRLLENGANSSFVNQVLDTSVPAQTVARDPFAALDAARPAAVISPPELFAPDRRNSMGFDLTDPATLSRIEAARAPFAAATWTAGPLLAGDVTGGAVWVVTNPATQAETVGHLTVAAPADIETALSAARPWSAPVNERAAALNRAADLYEAQFGEIFALLAREAGKTLPDAVGELREAVDFLRYYAVEAQGLTAPARGIFACISPWNFPLAIFTGQIAAALAAGNGVIAKPAEATGLIAHLATRLLHEAGVPHDALQLLPGAGADVGAALTSDPRIAGVCFTGSTETAQAINRTIATHLDPAAPLIAETGGLNAMIVDSTALPEQAVRDIVASAFQSAGQRCSALRILYVQEDVAAPLLEMLQGAMEELRLGDPWALSTDIGPVIDAKAKAGIIAHIERARAEGRVLAELTAPTGGTFVPPTILRLQGGIAALEREIFGPVLHVATYRAEQLEQVIAAVNARGFGLTFGMHSRIDDRVQAVATAIRVGNTYINRNQIGAVVGSQPFGGEGLSGTGPKAGGPAYLPRFTQSVPGLASSAPDGTEDRVTLSRALAALPDPRDRTLSAHTLPGPTGESNRLSTHPRGRVLCLGPGIEAAAAQKRAAEAAGCTALAVAGHVPPEWLADLDALDAVVLWADADTARPYAQALASRKGAIVPLVTEAEPAPRLTLERQLCIDTTAARGNAALLAGNG
ncbi:bifunctional proline dehydrogenase/L-glutamate gamma-semialdehyde dehydrogenase PutA [Roseicyclus marinus]|uniref:bifunctional proline dehydrogenase/L-glutamate gamma-semialdehyde dehydrogenase PutA n=1 Tax=Roseicyclus marinus TaxID=2161673 RepID=UPI00240FC383|nr:bifunctional proline dehydrogenase/L-glutamate gamma-semialdehyde dehydrogenase PutA [Roseicyclus marinus]MDG3040109.1 bifunctional proline dehydrogenase/L-glutamate gamma-semialdehyde dehydrogenase PutA [Roseicyclus marinus]